MHDNPESEIKFEDNKCVLQWIEINLKLKIKCVLAYSKDTYTAANYRPLPASAANQWNISSVNIC